MYLLICSLIGIQHDDIYTLDDIDTPYRIKFHFPLLK